MSNWTEENGLLAISLLNPPPKVHFFERTWGIFCTEILRRGGVSQAHWISQRFSWEWRIFSWLAFLQTSQGGHCKSRDVETFGAIYSVRVFHLFSHFCHQRLFKVLHFSACLHVRKFWVCVDGRKPTTWDPGEGTCAGVTSWWLHGPSQMHQA